MNNESVAWAIKSDNDFTEVGFGDALLEEVEQMYAMEGWKYEVIPLYTHPAKELNDGGEQVKNATYWKRQYNEMSSLNDRLKSSLYHANEQIKYLESHPAKTLTDEEILTTANGHCLWECKDDRIINEFTNQGLIDFAKAILRKASEK